MEKMDVFGSAYSVDKCLVQIYLNRSHIHGVLIECNDAYFEDLLSKTSLDQTDINYMALIDHAVLVGDRLVRTPFGLARFKDLSTGLKTLINAHHLVKIGDPIILNVTECGPNVLSYVFDEVAGSNVSLLLLHNDLAMGRDDWRFLINEDHVVDTVFKMSWEVGV